MAQNTSDSETRTHEGFRNGERVRHPEYGEGEVHLHPDGDHACLAGQVGVWFDNTPETTSMRVSAHKLESIDTGGKNMSASGAGRRPRNDSTDDKPECEECGRSRPDVTLIRMDDRILKTEAWYLCKECNEELVEELKEELCE